MNISRLYVLINHIHHIIILLVYNFLATKNKTTNIQNHSQDCTAINSYAESDTSRRVHFSAKHFVSRPFPTIYEQQQQQQQRLELAISVSERLKEDNQGSQIGTGITTLKVAFPPSHFCNKLDDKLARKVALVSL
jgi:hypothetical protein